VKGIRSGTGSGCLCLLFPWEPTSGTDTWYRSSLVAIRGSSFVALPWPELFEGVWIAGAAAWVMQPVGVKLTGFIPVFSLFKGFLADFLYVSCIFLPGLTNSPVFP
jgi:hypothetical protein